MKNYTSLVATLLLCCTSSSLIGKNQPSFSYCDFSKVVTSTKIIPSTRDTKLTPYFHVAELDSEDINLSLRTIHNEAPNQIAHTSVDFRNTALVQKKKTTFDPFSLLEGSLTNTISIVDGFDGNAYNNWYPADNALAVSDAGYMVSLTNSSIQFMDDAGQVYLNTQSLGQFYSDLNLGYFFYDPRIIFDRVQKRFVIVCLYSNTPSSSQVIISVSNSQNPMAGWYTTTIHTSYIAPSVWFDFPNVGVSNTDLFISGNLFTTNGTFDQTVVLQIDKDALYAGEAAEWEVFQDITNGTNTGVFAIKPMKYALESDYSDQMYFVSTNPGGGDTFQMYTVDGALESDQSLSIMQLGTLPYSNPLVAFQKDSEKQLKSGDVRVRDGLVFDGQLFFVHNTNINNGFSGIRVTQVDINSLEVDYTTYGLTGFDYAYPSIAPFDYSSDEPSFIVTALRSGVSVYPEIRAFEIQSNLECSSSILVKNGESPIAISSNTNQRWGDYTSTVLQYGTEQPTVWVFGSYGKEMKFGNYIAKISNGLTEEAPHAAFTTSTSMGLGPLTVTFSDNTQGPVENRYWSFPGGIPSFSTEANPTVIFPEEGLYDVSLTVSNAYGTDELVEDGLIQVGRLPEVDILVTNNFVSIDENVIFQAVGSNNILSYEWIIEGADNPVQTSANPVVSFSEPGVFSVELIVTNAFGSQTIFKEDYITVDYVSGFGTLIQDEPYLKIFPNPTSDRLNIDLQFEQAQECQIDILNAWGQVVLPLFAGKIKAGAQRLSFNTAHISSGVYYLVLRSATGKIIRNEKIIIQRT